MSGSKFQLLEEIKVLLLTKNNSNRSALESMLSFGSQKISVETLNNFNRGIKELKLHQYDIVILCHSILDDSDIIIFLQNTANVPVLIIDNYYNKVRSDNLLAAGALDYLDLSTLDSRLLLKSINFSIQQNSAEISASHAQRAMKIRSSFIANMSHEIRTPLNSIIGFSELLFEDETDPVKREKLNMIRQSGKHLLTLINSILDFSKLEAGKIQIDEKEFSLDNMIQTLYYMMLVKSGDSHIDLNIKPEGIIPELVTGDEFRLNQVLINLMNNAITFTEKGSVTLEYSYVKGFAVFSIIDTGIGIPENKINQIFNAFEQVNDMDTFNQNGTGLGLAISKSLINMMKGEISVESKPGLGSRFTVKLPLKVSRWKSDKLKPEITNHFPDRILGIVYTDVKQMKFLKDWLEFVNYEARWFKLEAGILPEKLFDCDFIMLPQEGFRSHYSDLLLQLRDDNRTSFKPKMYYSQRNSRLFFLINRNLIKNQLLEIPNKYLDKNLNSENFINTVNSINDLMQSLGKKLINKWKQSFDQDNPGLEDVLNEAIVRLYDRNRDLNLALLDNDYTQIEEIAHSLKGFTGQTCMYEVSNRANILLNEMRKKSQEPHPNVIQREVAAVNEIVWLLPRKMLGLKTSISSHRKLIDNADEMKILVAEDNTINQAVIRDFLRHFELDCDIVSNGKEALDKLRENEYNILFLDMQMPVMNGRETLEHIRDDEKLKDIYVVIITAYVSGSPELDHHKSNALLTKPYEKKSLMQILQDAAAYLKNKSKG